MKISLLKILAKFIIHNLLSVVDYFLCENVNISIIFITFGNILDENLILILGNF